MVKWLKGSHPENLAAVLGDGGSDEHKDGVWGSSLHTGVCGQGNVNGVLGWGSTKDAVGVRGKGFRGGLAGFFDGPVGIDGELKVNFTIRTLGDVVVKGAVSSRG